MREPGPSTRRSHEAGSRLVHSLEVANSLLIETVIGRREVTAFGQEDLFENRLHAPLGHIRSSLVSVQWLRNLLHPVIETIAVAVFCLIVFLTSRFSMAELPTVLPVIAVFAAASFRLFPLVTATGAQWVAVISRKTPAERILGMVEDRGPLGGHEEIRRMDRSIGLERVTFAYPGPSAALSNVSLRIEKGQRIALVGESGSGKSTIVSLIMGFIAAGDGTISIDGTPPRKPISPPGAACWDTWDRSRLYST